MYSGKVSVKENICNISKKLGYLRVSYSQVQGYDINSSNGKHFFVNIANEEHAMLSKYDASTKELVHTGDIKNVIMHGNDCAYYKGDYYIVCGSNSKKIKCYDSTFNYKKTYTFVPKSTYLHGNDISQISCIAHYKESKFILGYGSDLAICNLEEDRFSEIYRIELNENQVIGIKMRGGTESCSGQGIYCKNNELYKVYSFVPTGQEHSKLNTIAVFEIPDENHSDKTSPAIASLSASYTCDRPEKTTFEIEGVSSYGSNMYMIANVTEGKTQKDSIYRISLN